MHVEGLVTGKGEQNVVDVDGSIPWPENGICPHRLGSGRRDHERSDLAVRNVKVIENGVFGEHPQ